VAVGVGSRTRQPVLVSHGAPALGCDAVAYAGSLAKQITGASAALLARRGALDVDVPIATWLGELPPWSQTVRVRHLVHHTAGLPSTEAVWDRMERAGERDWTSDGVLAALSTVDVLEYEPGASYAYSNVGYICLARIVEHVSGTELGAFADEQLFGPFHMASTTVWSGPEPSPPGAVLARPLQSPRPLSVGDGGLWTSVNDLLLWNDALLVDALGLSERLHTTGSLDDGSPLDYGWGVRVFDVGGNRVESHGGSWDDATAKLVRFPDLGVGFAELALDGAVERMVALSDSLQAELLTPSG
jgi:CubicO group peptidase (beta-lactamase class C family)